MPVEEEEQQPSAEGEAESGSQSQPQNKHQAAVHPGFLPDEVSQELWAVFEGRSAVEDNGSELMWDIEEREAQSGGQEMRATVTFSIHTVPHHFAGGWCPSEAETR